jgi:hypothetical protein
MYVSATFCGLCAMSEVELKLPTGLMALHWIKGRYLIGHNEKYISNLQECVSQTEEDATLGEMPHLVYAVVVERSHAV